MERLKITVDISNNKKTRDELYLGNFHEMTQSPRENITF